MISKNAILISFFISFSLSGMETSQSNALIATPPVRVDVPSLKKLATNSFVNAFDPENQKYDSNRLKALVSKVNSTPKELQEYLGTAILKEKADVLENINKAECVKLSDKKIQPWLNMSRNPLMLSPDSSYMCYIMQKNGDSQRPTTIVLTHLPTKTETLITSDDISSLKHQEFLSLSRLGFTNDNASIVWHGVADYDENPIYQYHIPSKTLSILAKLSGDGTNLAHIGLDGKKFLSSGFLRRPRIVDTEKNSLIELPGGGKAVLNSATGRVVTHDFSKQKMYCCQSDDGSILFEAHHPPSSKRQRARSRFSPDGTMIATGFDNVVHIRNSETGLLLTKVLLAEPSVLERGALSFVEKDQIIIGVTLPNEYSYNLVRVNCDTKEWAVVARKLSVLSLSPVTMSRDMLLFLGTQLDDKIALCHTFKQKVLNHYTKEPVPVHYRLCQNDAAVVFDGSPIASKNRYPYMYSTHRAITNTASLENLLELFIAEKQRANNQPIDPSIIASLKASPSERLREVVKERYERSESSIVKERYECHEPSNNQKQRIFTNLLSNIIILAITIAIESYRN
jgi:hypothetical protein